MAPGGPAPGALVAPLGTEGTRPDVPFGCALGCARTHVHTCARVGAVCVSRVLVRACAGSLVKGQSPAGGPGRA